MKNIDLHTLIPAIRLYLKENPTQTNKSIRLRPNKTNKKKVVKCAKDEDGFTISIMK